MIYDCMESGSDESHLRDLQVPCHATYPASYSTTTLSAFIETTVSSTMQSVGADEVVDYTKEDFSEKYKDKPFDAIVDLIGGDVELKSYNVLKENGTFAHIR